MPSQSSRSSNRRRSVLLPYALATACVLMAGALLQLPSAPTYAHQLAQLVAVTQTPVISQPSELLFIRGGDAHRATLTRLSASALSEALSLNRSAPSDTLTPVGEAASISAGCEPMGMHAAPSGPWVAMELACVGGEASVVQILYIANVQDNTVQAATSFANTLVEAPVWSLDGAQLAFAAMPSGGGVSDVWLYAPNTNVVTRVTQDADTRYPVFTSDR